VGWGFGGADSRWTQITSIEGAPSLGSVGHLLGACRLTPFEVELYDLGHVAADKEESMSLTDHALEVEIR
jgi:hypothetical protein